MSEVTPIKPASTPAKPKRRGWYSPVRPGPSRRALVLSVVAGLLALVAWLVFAIDATHHVDTHAKVVVRDLSIDDSGQLKLPNGATHPATGYRGSRGLRYAVVHTTVPMPDSAGRMRIDVQLPAGVEPSDAVLRARTPAAVVTLRRTKAEHAPYVDVTRVRSGDINVDVLVALPAEGLLVDEPANAPKLSSATKPYDDHVVDEARSGRRLAKLHRWSGLLVALAIVVGMIVPIGLVVYLRRRWYQPVPQPQIGAAKPAGPPTTKSAVEAAAITRGARGVSIPDAFAAQVLELVARDAIKLRHTLDPRTGEGSVIGIGSAIDRSDVEGQPLDTTTLDGAALALLVAVTNTEGDTVQLPDRADRLTEQLAQTGGGAGGRLETARADWRSALERHLTQYAVVEHARSRYVGLLALGCIVFVVLGVITGMFSELDGTSALAWFYAAAALAPAAILSALMYELRGWTRVRPNRTDERLRWLAWRGVLDEAAASGSVDRRVLPYAAATGSIEGIAPRRAGPTDVGLAAATPELIASLRRVAGARA